MNHFEWREIKLPRCIGCGMNAAVNMLEIIDGIRNEFICYDCVLNIVRSFNTKFGVKSVEDIEKDFLAIAQKIVSEAFDEVESVSHTGLKTAMRIKGFTEAESEESISWLLSKGFMYEFKSGFYKKA